MLCPVLIGREQELGTLTSALEAAASGQGGVVVVVGEAGSGKSRLVRELVDSARARGGVTVLMGRAVAGPVQAPYQPLTEAVLRISFDMLLELPELRAFRSSLGQLLPDGDPADQQPESDSPLLVGEGLRRLLRVLRGSRTGLLVLEDLHWADRESLAVLDYLAGQALAESLLVVATLRPGEAGAAAAVVDAMLDRRAAQAIYLDRLDRSQTTQLTRACLGAAPTMELADFVADWSDGLPFLAEELLASLVSDGLLAEVDGRWTLTAVPARLVPPTFAAAVRRRLDSLSAQDRDVVHAAAVLGRRFEWRLLAPITGLSDDGVSAALRNAAHRQLLSETGDVSFRHALTRMAVLAQLLAPERATLARHALAALEQSDPTLRGAHCELAADLAEQAGQPVRSAALLLEAGERATRRGALATAESMLRRGAGLAVDDPELSIAIDDALTHVHAYAGQTDRAIELGTRLLARIEPGTSSRVDRAALHLRLARVGLAAGRWTLVADHVNAARRTTGPAPAGVTSVVDAVDAQLALGRGDLDGAVQLASTALVGAEEHGLPETACEALEVLGRVARQRDLAQAERAFEHELSTAEHHDLPLWRLRALHELGTIDQLRTESVERLAATRELAVGVGAHALLATVDLQIAAGLLKQFRTEEGLTAARRCVDASRRLRLATLPMALVLEATAFAQQRQAQTMEGVLAEALTLAREDLDVQGCAWGHCRATLSILEEQRGRALSELASGVRLLQQSPATVAPPFLGVHVLLLAVAGEDRRAEVEAALVRTSEATRHQIVADLLGCADAVLLGRAGRPAEAAAAYEAADERMGPLVAWYRQLARRLVAEAALADGWGEPVPWLREAAGFFAGRGDEQIAGACRTLLRDAGVPVPRARPGSSTVPAALVALGVTSREADVLHLVGDGLTNAEIAGRLYLSPRTVEKHVASLLLKTSCRRRAELAAYVARLTG